MKTLTKPKTIENLIKLQKQPKRIVLSISVQPDQVKKLNYYAKQTGVLRSKLLLIAIENILIDLKESESIITNNNTKTKKKES